MANNSHQSAQFLEHLRTVHFVLITISAALLVFIFGTKELPIEKARTQATEILDLAKKWDLVKREAADAASRNAHVSNEHALAVKITSPASP